MDAGKPSYSGHRKRLRQRFLKSGFAGFADYEVVELLLTLAIPRADVKPVAKALLRRFGSFRAILDAPREELRQVKGVGEISTVALRLMRETANLYLQHTVEARQCLGNWEALTRFWRLKIGSLANETFHVGYLDSGLRLLRDGVETLEEGTVDRATIYPRRIIEAALRRGAAALVFAHNHPSGDVHPSKQDKLVTASLLSAASTVSIQILDHLIVSADKVFSFRQAGLL
jgi:DNA repair protein RadC